MIQPVRMVREDWYAFIGNCTRGGPGVTLCSCGSSLWTQQELRSHWQEGHFDCVAKESTPAAEPLKP